jgi:glycosyltransferase involved in cell wall biosynthesis
MSKVSVCIIGYNEEKKIAAAITSVIDWADEVVVIDSYSTDKTAEIASRLGAKVVQVPFEGFGKLRNDAIVFCKHPWIFSLDADERCTPGARDEILNIVRANDQNGPVAYLIPRRNYFLGQWVKFSGWYPDYRQPQLFRKEKMTYSLSLVHEEYEVHGQIGKTCNPIWQYPFEDIAQMMHKANRYSTLGAQKHVYRKKGGLTPALTHGIWSFIQTYIFRGGILDGRAGFAIAYYDCYSTFYKYLKLKELQAKWKEPKRFEE